MKKLILLFILIYILQLHNIFSFPLTRGFDAIQHIDYIHFIQKNHILPAPNQGFEMWQPPLYYPIGALLPSLYLLRIIHFIIWMYVGLCTYLYFKKETGKSKISLIATIIMTSLPVVIYSLPDISNEFMASFSIIFTFIYYVSHRDLTTIRTKLLLGILLGITLLLKATAVVILSVIIIDILISGRKHIKTTVKKLCTILIPTILLGGWFYLKNIILYRNPFISSVDFPVFAYTEKPWDRSIFGFFLNLKPFLNLDLFTAHHKSLLAGTYFSYFFDGHNNIIPPQEFSKIGAILVFASLPLVIFALRGFLITIKNITDKNRIYILYPSLLFIFYILYNLKIPYYSTVKGLFLMTTIFPFIYFFIQGIKSFKNRLWIWEWYVVFYCLLIFRNFWIISSWYR